MIKERSKTAFLCIFLSCGFCKTYDFIMIANDNNSYCLHFLKSKKGQDLLFYLKSVYSGRQVGRQAGRMHAYRQADWKTEASLCGHPMH